MTWRAYGQKDPLNEYQKEAFNLLAEMWLLINQLLLYYIVREEFSISHI
jgi:preprotein translocase subunit SecA